MEPDRRTNLLFLNLAITALAPLPLKRLNAPLEHIAQRARLRDEVLQLLGIALRRGVVRVVERAGMEV